MLCGRARTNLLIGVLAVAVFMTNVLTSNLGAYGNLSDGIHIAAILVFFIALVLCALLFSDVHGSLEFAWAPSSLMRMPDVAACVSATIFQVKRKPASPASDF